MKKYGVKNLNFNIANCRAGECLILLILAGKLIKMDLPHCCKNLRRSAFVIARVKP
jgi:hypothetical protein